MVQDQRIPVNQPRQLIYMPPQTANMLGLWPCTNPELMGLFLLARTLTSTLRLPF
jgi:hypothetical protein